MPIKLVPPRKGKSPNWSIRGTYLGVYVEKSCGSHKRSVARTVLKRLIGEIERGEYPPREAPPCSEQPTFLSAAVKYMEAGRRSRYVARLIKHFGETPLTEIGQAEIDAAAVALYPNVTPATRNTCVYTPVSAILRHAGIALNLKRPKGSKGRIVTDWLTLEDASAIILAAEAFDREFAALLKFLLYTGVRLGEALKLSWSDVRLAEATAWVRRQKDGPASDVRLRKDLQAALSAHREALGGDPRRRVFRFHQGGHLKHQLVRAKMAALGLPCLVRRPVGWRQPDNRLAWVNFHSFRHTWATWMRRYAHADLQDLVATDNWRNRESAARYAHAIARDAWDKVELLPALKLGMVK